ncbi:hypothetical protein [Paraburkholderia sp. GAS42]|uniref:hypothetical protein n=1 Tax=Paraburkholderia sp. GAS42 TaxID=3035135 RepID=UPI003D22342D
MELEFETPRWRRNFVYFAATVRCFSCFYISWARAESHFLTSTLLPKWTIQSYDRGVPRLLNLDEMLSKQDGAWSDDGKTYQRFCGESRCEPDFGLGKGRTRIHCLPSGYSSRAPGSACGQHHVGG